MKRRKRLIGMIYFLCFLLVSVQFINAQKLSQKAKRKPDFHKKLNFYVVEEENVKLKSLNNVWSEPEKTKSSRLLYYKTEKMVSGKKRDVMVSKETGRVFLEKGSSFIGNKHAYRKTKYINEPPYQVYEIYDLNGKLLSTVKFNKPNTFGWDGPYKEVIWGVDPEYFFDDGQYIGIDYEDGTFHVVNPPLNVYKEIPIFNPSIPIEYLQAVWGSSAYNSQNKDMFILFMARSRWDAPTKRFAFVCLLIDKMGNVLWRREKPTVTWSMMSPGGEYMVLFTEEKGKDAEGPVEIIRRDGSTVAIINTPFSVSSDRFSEDMKLIGFREKHKKINIYEVQTGKLINKFTFNGYHPVERIAINHQKNLLYVLRDYPAAYPEGNRYLSIYDLYGSAKLPLWEYDMGAFNRKSKDYSGTYLSISGDGEEITAYSNGVLRIFRMAK